MLEGTYYVTMNTWLPHLERGMQGQGTWGKQKENNERQTEKLRGMGE